MAQDTKTLKKIALACRQAGIMHYKCPEFEITLTPDAPQSNYKKRTTKSTPSTSDNIDNQTQLTEEQLLFYSVADIDAQYDKVEN